jgi:Uma2 family endonuclease
MSSKLTVDEYFRQPETMYPMELVYGEVHEPPAPRWGHQQVVLRLGSLLDQHVRSRQIGKVGMSPVDVVLDRERALVVQPDVLFVSTKRLGIIGDRVWGAPDLVVEVLSYGTARRDQTVKLGWYKQYGVRECWLIDPFGLSVSVVDCENVDRLPADYAGSERIRSAVLPDFDVSAALLFE